jgi:acetylornithine deacetylase
MLDPITTAAIRQAVRSRFEEQIAFTAEMVRHPSTRGNEASMQDFMERAFHARGLDLDRFPVDIEAIRNLRGYGPTEPATYVNATNVVGTAKCKAARGRSLILNGHIDVVPAGDPSRWSTPPFEPRREEKWLTGRGAGDMKSGLAACIFAYDAIRSTGLKLDADVIFQAVVDEEATGNGTLACLARGYDADCVLIAEPFGPRLLRAQIGPVWFRVEIRGDPQHASGFQSAGANAIEKAFVIWSGLKRLEVEWNARAKSSARYGDHPHPIRFNLGKISGGDWPSSVPSSCVFEARTAVLPGWDLDAACKELSDAIAAICEADDYLRVNPAVVTFHGFRAEGAILTDADEAERVLADSHHAVFGAPLEDHVSPASTDSRFYTLYRGTPALVYGPICERAHGYDERVDLDSLLEVTEAIALFIADWCGVSAA